MGNNLDDFPKDPFVEIQAEKKSEEEEEEERFQWHREGHIFDEGQYKSIWFKINQEIEQKEKEKKMHNSLNLLEIKEIVELKNRNSQLSQEKDNFGNQIKSITNKNIQLENEKAKLTQQRDNQASEAISLKNIIEQKEKEIIKLKARNEQLSKERDNLISETIENKKIIESGAIKTNDLLSENSKKRKENDNLLADILKITKENNELKSEFLKLSKEKEFYHVEFNKQKSLFNISEINEEKFKIFLLLFGKAFNVPPIIFNENYLNIKSDLWVNQSEFQVDKSKPMATGGFSKIQNGEWNGQPIAVKVSSGLAMDLQVFREIVDEAILLKMCNHPNIVKVHKLSVKPIPDPGANPLYLAELSLLLELLEDNLEVKINKKTMSLKKKLEVCIKIVEAVIYLHKKNIVHCDLKPTNILFDKNDEPKIIDLGISRRIKSENITTILNKGNELTGVSLNLIPPEYKEKSLLSTKFDIFDLGLLFYEVFAEKSCLNKIDSTKSFFDYQPKLACSNNLNTFIENCLEFKHEKRPDAEKLRNDLLTVKFNIP